LVAGLAEYNSKTEDNMLVKDEAEAELEDVFILFMAVSSNLFDMPAKDTASSIRPLGRESALSKM
jgi:hypothetical protein